jgi:hypothetical protein
LPIAAVLKPRARGVEDRRLVEIVAGEMRVDVAEHRIVFEERRHAAAGGRQRIAGEDGVAEGAGIAEIVTARHAGGIRHGEGREQRVRIGEIDAALAQRRHGRRGLGAHLQCAEPVRNEQDEIARLRPIVGASGEQQEGAQG